MPKLPLELGWSTAATLARTPPQSGICGIWDSLRAGRHDEAGWGPLAVASCHQQSLDNGSWILAEQFCLEPAPPLSAFANRRQTQHDAVDSKHSKLVESRWGELCLHRVRELEQHMEVAVPRHLPTVPPRVPKRGTRKKAAKATEVALRGARTSNLNHPLAVLVIACANAPGTWGCISGCGTILNQSLHAEIEYQICAPSCKGVREKYLTVGWKGVGGGGGYK